jgi:hypothetical protein
MSSDCIFMDLLQVTPVYDGLRYVSALFRRMYRQQNTVSVFLCFAQLSVS